jgi:hypothetical protein
VSRLAAQADLEYIPTQEKIRPLIRSYLNFSGQTTCLDPCCGPGEALIEICPDHHLFGLEYHTGRALEAKASKKFKKILAGPFENSIISNRAFGFIHLNPPYDWVAGGKQRYEEQFLYRATNYLANKGILEYIVPTTLFQYRGVDIYKFLLSNYNDLQIYKYPEPEFSTFKQIVIFGTKKPRERITASPEWFAKQAAKITAGNIPVLTMQEKPIFNVPIIHPNVVRTFIVNHYDAKLAETEISTLNILKQVSKPVLSKPLTAPFLLDKALLALLSVGGYIDGKMPGHFLLGKYENSEVKNTEVDTDTGDEIHTTRKVSSTVFHLLCKNPNSEGTRIIEIR